MTQLSEYAELIVEDILSSQQTFKFPVFITADTGTPPTYNPFGRKGMWVQVRAGDVVGWCFRPETGEFIPDESSLRPEPNGEFLSYDTLDRLNPWTSGAPPPPNPSETLPNRFLLFSLGPIFPLCGRLLR